MGAQYTSGCRRKGSRDRFVAEMVARGRIKQHHHAFLCEALASGLLTRCRPCGPISSSTSIFPPHSSFYRADVDVANTAITQLIFIPVVITVAQSGFARGINLNGIANPMR